MSDDDIIVGYYLGVERLEIFLRGSSAKYIESTSLRTLLTKLKSKDYLDKILIARKKKVKRTVD